MSIATHGCGARWHQAGNRTSHCAACHLTFSSTSVFDLHQRGGTCADPASLLDKSGQPRLKTFTDSEGCTIWRSAAEIPEGTFKR